MSTNWDVNDYYSSAYRRRIHQIFTIPQSDCNISRVP